MKITNIKAIPVNIPLEAPYIWSVGLFPGTSRAVVIVETDEGITGIGEAPSHRLVDIINKEIAPRLIGKNPLLLNECELRAVPDWYVSHNTDDTSIVKAYGGVEIALWDIQGKYYGKPIYELLGGAFRKEIKFSEYFVYRQSVNGVGGENSPEAIVEFCQRMHEEHGSYIFEGKVLTGNPKEEVDTFKALREHFGDKIVLRADANYAWSLSTARWIMRELEPLNIENYEDPVASFEDMSILRQHTSIPFSTHVPDLRRAVSLNAPDNFVVNIAALGGIKKTIEFVNACQAMGKGVWMYSGDSGIGTAAYLHVVAATQWLIHPSQCLTRFYTHDVIEEGPLVHKNNVIPVPEKPGLGVTLSEEGLAYCHQHFLEHGPLDTFENPDHPDVYKRLPLA